MEITVKLEDRPDGGLRAFSDDVPGLVVSGPHQDVVLRQIPIAAQALLGYMPKRFILQFQSGSEFEMTLPTQP